MINLKILQIIFLAILIQNSLHCGKGCLKCINQKCLICDQKNFYIKGENYCVLKIIKNCKKISKNGFCLICEKEFYFSENLNRCEKVHQKIENCIIYKNATNCEICKKKFYIKEGKCEKIKIDVLNCLVHQRDYCLVCEKGYFLHFSKERCIQKDDNHCLIYDFVDCEECEFGFVKENNFFLINLKNKFISFENLENQIIQNNESETVINNENENLKNNNINLENNSNIIQSFNENVKYFQEIDIFFNFENDLYNPAKKIKNQICVKSKTDNCLKNDDYKNCLICKKNYYLTKNNQCKEYPLQKIENCETYINEYMCEKCEINYKLIQPNICTEIKKIENCRYHSQIDSFDKCLECELNFFLKNNECLKRKNLILNCTEHNVNKDNCQKCETNLILGLNNLFCLKKIENCEEYNIFEENSYSCIKCQPNFVLENNLCILGNIENCEYYLINKKCEKCKNGFFLQNELCEKNTEIFNCLNYSQERIKICEKCDNSSFLVNYQKTCILIENLITNCVKYENKDICEECENYYFLYNNNCVLISNDENCIRKRNNLCVFCKNGYLLKNGICEKINFFFTQNCLEFENSGLNNIAQCSKCREDYFPINTNEKFLCHQKSDLLKLPEFIEIGNCLKYEKIGNEIFCKKCDKDLFISESGKDCLENCENQKLLYFADDSFTETFYKKSKKGIYNKCINIEEIVENCEIASLTTNNNDINKYICIKCKPGNLEIIKNNGNILLNPFNPKEDFYRQNQNSSENYFLRKTSYFSEKYNIIFGINYLGFYCQQPPGGIYSYESTNTTDPEPNCELFSFISLLNSIKITCQRCKFGYTGTISFFTYNGVTYKNMFCEKEIEFCDKDVRFGGLSSLLAKNTDLNFAFLNCHKCKNKKKPVFAFNEDFDFLDIFKNNWFNCLDITAKTFGVEKEVFMRNKIENCGFYKYYTNRPKIFKKGVFYNMIDCLYCEPGFKPFFDENHEKVVKCEKIKNCIENSVWFNSCSKCKEYYTWNFKNENNGKFIIYHNCIKFNDMNCLISSKNNNTCILCKKEYTINTDGICEILNFPNCQNKFSKELNLFFNINALNKDFFVTFPFLIENNTGCSLCENEFLSYNMNSNSYFCVFSEYLQKKIYKEISYISYFINNCRFYKNINDNLKCSECDPNYILTEDKNKCFHKDNFPHCLKIENDNTNCKICREKFVNINGFCEFGKIDFCLNYILNENIQKCEKCINKYVLKENNCIEGIIKNCKEYDNDGLCLKCEDDYTLYNNNYCLFTKLDFFCEKGILDIFGNFECEKCLINHAFFENEEKRSKCVLLTEIKNCKRYNNLEMIQNSTFLCEECEIGYFLQNEICHKRTNIIEFCFFYNIHNDFCDKCLKNYFLTNLKKCKNNPKGIKNCILYNNTENCIKCDKNYYLNNNKCKYIDIKVKNCDFYKNINICQICKKGYFLTENFTCEKSKIENCIEQNNKDTCKKCRPNFGFFEKNGKISCSFLTKINCMKINQNFPYNCISCENFYYEDNGECFPNTNFIKNCEIYESEDSCRKCKKQYILNYKKKKCFSNNLKKIEKDEKFKKNSENLKNVKNLDLIENCVNNKEKTKICLICDYGYVFYKNKCIKCEKATFEKGCLYCEIYYSEKCLLCKSGYFMDFDGICIKNNTEFILQRENIEIRNFLNFSLIFISKSFLFYVINL